ncbi:MAG: CARDB domain-containing protein [Jatrophihabitantaceae bacterium]
MQTSSMRRRLAFVAVAATALAISGAVAASGSTPSSGTVTDTSGAKTWTGGPFLVANTTATAGDPVCTLPQSCDDYTLTVSTPAGYGDANNLKISVGWPNAAADFDVYLLNSAGATVASAASSADPEVIVVPPTSATYTVRVVPFAPLGQSYSASAAMAVKSSSGPPPSTAPAPSMANYGAPQTLPDAHNAGEPSIGNSWLTGSSFYQAYLSTYKVRFNDAVTPPAATWSDVSAKAANGCAVGSTISLDPILYTDATTGRTFESQLSGVNSLTCYTDDEGATWHPSTGGGIPSGVDHQTLGGGAFVAGDPLNAANLSPRAVYYCSQDIATAFCALSRDGGTTFGAGVPVYNLLDCGGLHGHIMVAPDGTAYLPNKSCGGHQGVTVSSDNGKTWTVRTVPNSLPGDSDPAVSIGANGTVYLGYANGDGTQHVAVSHDKGATWVNDYDIGAAQGVKNTVFPTAVAGDDNRAAVSWIGTTTAGNYQDAANFHGVWHLYTAFTYDGGASWVTVDDTPTDPVQIGSICTGGTTCGNDRNLLDFIGSTVDKQGRVQVGWADGCTGSCSTTGVNNFDAYATITRQYAGLTLFAASDPAANLTVSGLSAPVASNGSSSITATVTNLGKAAATAPVQFQVNGKVLSTSAPVAVPAGTSKTVTVPWSTKQLRGTQTVLAIADPANVVTESNESDNRRSISVTIK